MLWFVELLIFPFDMIFLAVERRQCRPLRVQFPDKKVLVGASDEKGRAVEKFACTVYSGDFD